MDNNLLSGLEGLGLGNLKDLNLYESGNKSDKDVKKNAQAVSPETKEEDMVFDKTFTCPVCDEQFKAKMVRAGKAKAMLPDQDLRPRYEGIDVLKYDILSCPHCGYSGLSKNFPYLTPNQKKAIKENICESFIAKPDDPQKKIYTYEDAIERHKLALVNTIVKHGKASEKAFICLKTGWLFRGQGEKLDITLATYDAKKEDCDKAEIEFLRNAYDGFIQARTNESFPIAGMDELTLDYLLAALALRFEEYDTASRLISSILTSRTANARIKDKARDLKDILAERKKG